MIVEKKDCNEFDWYRQTDRLIGLMDKGPEEKTI